MVELIGALNKARVYTAGRFPPSARPGSPDRWIRL